MFKKTYFKASDWNSICDICGEKHKASEMYTRWDGLKVCREDWEQRHPQDFIKPIKERNSVPWTRPRPEDQDVTICTLLGVTAIAGQGTAGCMIAGYDNGLRQLTFPSTFNLSTL